MFIDNFYFFGTFDFQDISEGGLLIDDYFFQVDFSYVSLDKQYNKANIPYYKCPTSIHVPAQTKSHLFCILLPKNSRRLGVLS
jgi:hypothetical protein